MVQNIGMAQIFLLGVIQKLIQTIKLVVINFDDYKFIEIPKDVYDSYLAANGSSTRYKDRGNHKTESDKGTHEHITKTVKKKSVDKDGKPIFKDGKQVYEDVQVPDRIKYSIPAAEFKNQDYWKSGSFYYETGQNKTVGISGVINKGKTIFWKETKKRLTSETPPK